MPNLRLQTVVQAHLSDYLGPSDADNKKFVYLLLDRVFELSLDESEEAYTDSPHDKGVDAIFEKEDEEGVTLFIVQSKYFSQNPNQTFSDDTRLKMFAFIENYLYDTDIESRERTEKEEKYFSFHKRIADGDIDKVTVVFASNGQPPTANFAKEVEYKIRASEGRIECLYITEKELFDYYYAESTKEVEKLELIIQSEPGTGAQTNIRLPEIDSTKGYVTKIDIYQLAEIVESYPNIFNKNVRSFQSIKNKVNKQIEETLCDSNKVRYFGYLNNGITILCDRIVIGPGGTKYTLHRPSIINGCQTASTIREVFKLGKLEPNIGYVLLRIICTTDESLAMDVITASNTQTAVRARDLISEQQIHKEIEAEMETYGYFYERKKNMYASKPRSKRIELERVAQLYLAMVLQKPADAKNKKREIFGAFYEQIFNPSINAKKLLVGHLFYQLVDNIVNTTDAFKLSATGLRKSIIKNSRFHILALIYRQIFENNESSWNKVLEQIPDLTINKLKEQYGDAVNAIISKVVHYVEDDLVRSEEGFNVQYFFKATSSFEKLAEGVLE